jgi:hypothetical protein
MDALNTTMLIALAIFVGVDALFLRITRRSHPDVWEELGSPGMLHSDPNKIYRYFLHRSVSRHSRSSFRVVLRLHSFHTNRRLCTTDVVRGVIGHVLGSAMVFRLTIR